MAAAQAAGVAVGLYHYARPSTPVVEDARSQARTAFAAAGDASGPGVLPQALDLEKNPDGLTPEELALWARTWLEETRSLSGRTPLLYTYPAFFTENVSPDPALAAYPLWIAHYGLPVTSPTVPAPWTGWTFWQYSSHGSVPGVDAEVDLNVFAGSARELALLAGRSVGDPAEGVSMVGNALLSAVTHPGNN